MPNRFFRILAACLFLLTIMSVHAMAQVDTPKVEVGVHFSYLRFRGFGENDTGFGGRLTFNLTENIAIEGDYTHFSGPFFFDTSRSREQILVGVKTGIRSESAGMFFKIRPGVMKFNGTTIPGICEPAGSLACTLAAGTNQFALDIGGVFELYPIKKVVFRFDIGNTVIRFGGPYTDGPGFTSSNFQAKVGIGVRF